MVKKQCRNELMSLNQDIVKKNNIFNENITTNAPRDSSFVQCSNLLNDILSETNIY